LPRQQNRRDEAACGQPAFERAGDDIRHIAEAGLADERAAKT